MLHNYICSVLWEKGWKHSWLAQDKYEPLSFCSNWLHTRGSNFPQNSSNNYIYRCKHILHLFRLVLSFHTCLVNFIIQVTFTLLGNKPEKRWNKWKLQSRLYYVKEIQVLQYKGLWKKTKHIDQKCCLWYYRPEDMMLQQLFIYQYYLIELLSSSWILVVAKLDLLLYNC